MDAGVPVFMAVVHYQFPSVLIAFMRWASHCFAQLHVSSGQDIVHNQVCCAHLFAVLVNSAGANPFRNATSTERNRSSAVAISMGTAATNISDYTETGKRTNRVTVA